ncbi:LysE family translocator [Flexibacterium corallicola]|uniref:LysE family translocator n=1 Tax=Flexibacterium corallicola TaxID=3037259 RepID=UPI00286F4C5A|nr:LysE family translocator [Pseudovibrio sp. M1P-2-3]
MEFSSWAIFAGAYLVLTFSPGPNVFLVLTHASAYGLRGAVITILGNLFCQLLIVIFVALGVGALLTADTLAYQVMKYAGAIYLCYLGAKGLRDLWSKRGVGQKNLQGQERMQATPPWSRRFVQAFAVSASNPKTVIFLSAFLPQFVVPNESLPLQFSVMYLTLAAIVLMVHMAYAVIVIGVKAKAPTMESGGILPLISSILFIGLGVGLGFSR